MANSSLDLRRRAKLASGTAVLLLACTIPAMPDAAAAESRTARRDGAVTLDAASSDVDYRSNTVVFRDIVITQGEVRVAAAQARATGLDFDDSTWTFSGAVRINVDGGALRSDDATVKFGANRVASARIRGTPAEFEQARGGANEAARGRAGTIEYDVAAGTVRLLGDAWLSDGRTEIRGQELTYDVRAQRVQSGSDVAKRAFEAFHLISDGVAKTNESIAAIDSATGEQSRSAHKVETLIRELVPSPERSGLSRSPVRG